MPTNGDGQGQVPTASSPDSNGQVPPVSHSSTDLGDNDDGASSGQDMTPDQYRKALERANAQAAKYRVESKELAELRAFKQQAEDAKLSADEKRDRALAEAQQRAADAETRAQGIAVRAEVKGVARELGIKPELAVKLLDYAEITFNEDGDPTNVAELLAKAVEDFGLVMTAPGTPSTPAQTPPQQQPAAPRISATNPPRDGRGGQVARKDPAQMARFGQGRDLFRNQ